MKLILKRVSATSGFLQDAAVEFVPGLNCIIGARGTCKTTLVESIRFAFDANENKRIGELTARADANGKNEGLIRASLRAGVVRCDVAVNDSRENYDVTLERELDAAPRTYRDGVREYTSSELLGHIEIYSQGDLQRLAQDDEQQMRLDLIDRPQRSKIQQLKEERQKCIVEVKEIGPELKSVRAEIQDRSREVESLAELQHELQGLQRSRQEMPDGLEETFRGALKRKAILADLQEATKALSEATVYVAGSSNYGVRLRSLAEKLEGSDAKVLHLPLQRLRQALATLAQCAGSAGSLQTLSISLSDDYSVISRQFEVADNEYYKLRQEQQQLNESLKKEETLRTQINHLEELQSELEELLEREQQLIRERARCRASISAKSDQIYTLRLAEIESVNRKHSDIVLLTLTAGEQTGEYRERLTDLLSGSRLKLQDEVAADISRKLKPAELIDHVEQGSSTTLSEVLARDVGQMMRLIAHLAEHPEFYELEGSIFEDRLDVTMYDNGQPKKVETLSKGQKATALLPLVLRPAPYPLIVDQPEDDLDNSFIFQSLVKVVRELKTERQLIFVTHNANIPVLGDAERVVVMSMANPSSAAPPRSGTVDERKSDVLDLLEGGREAFEERERHYSDLLGGGLRK